MEPRQAVKEVGWALRFLHIPLSLDSLEKSFDQTCFFLGHQGCRLGEFLVKRVTPEREREREREREIKPITLKLQILLVINPCNTQNSSTKYMLTHWK